MGLKGDNDVKVKRPRSKLDLQKTEKDIRRKSRTNLEDGEIQRIENSDCDDGINEEMLKPVHRNQLVEDDLFEFKSNFHLVTPGIVKIVVKLGPSCNKFLNFRSSN